MTVTIYFDGLSEPVNPSGVGAWGFIVKSSAINVTRNGICPNPFTPEITNNVAEYTALIKALEYLESKRIAMFADTDLHVGLMPDYDRDVRAYGDSKLVINQMAGEWQVKSSRMYPLYQRALELSKSFNVKYKWIPREENTIADELSFDAYADYMRSIGKPPIRMKHR